jgi:biopolymer transport protein ExbD
MAFSTSGGSGGTTFGRGRGRRGGTLSEINIIPLVDVVLVLLIIFMLTAHVMEFGLEVEVPKVKQEKTSAQDLPVLSMSREGVLYLGDKPVNINELGPVVKKRYPRADSVYFRADKAATWDAMAQVISELNTAKLQIRLVTQPEDIKDKGKRQP